MHLSRVLLTVHPTILTTFHRQRWVWKLVNSPTVLVVNVFSFTESVCVCHNGKMWSWRNLLWQEPTKNWFWVFCRMFTCLSVCLSVCLWTAFVTMMATIQDSERKLYRYEWYKCWHQHEGQVKRQVWSKQAPTHTHAHTLYAPGLEYFARFCLHVCLNRFCHIRVRCSQETLWECSWDKNEGWVRRVGCGLM